MLRGLFIFIAICLTVPLSAAEPKTLAIGASAPDFSLPGVDDKTYTLADFADEDILVIVFTCNHCPTAQAYEQRIKALVENYKNKPVAIVAVSPNSDAAVRLDELGFTDLGDSFEDMKVRAKEHEFDFPYLYDGKTQSMAQAYGPLATPHVFVFDKDRKLRFCGRIDDGENPKNIKSKDTENAIDALLAEKPVPVETTRTIGCSIKWTDKIPSAEESLAKWNEETAELKEIDIEGIKHLVANDTKKVRVINVWATWCGPCVSEFPELVEINRMYRNRDFEFVTITADPPERREQALEFLNKQHASMTNYIFNEDDPYKLADALGFEWQGALPYTAVIAPGGKVVFSRMGPVEPLALKQAIVAELGRYYFKMEEPSK
jgi:thiol-disulfide isomerase/thioredoxin